MVSGHLRLHPEPILQEVIGLADGIERTRVAIPLERGLLLRHPLS